jgi:hypothetical protein
VSGLCLLVEQEALRQRSAALAHSIRNDLASARQDFAASSRVRGGGGDESDGGGDGGTEAAILGGTSFDARQVRRRPI